MGYNKEGKKDEIVTILKQESAVHDLSSTSTEPPALQILNTVPFLALLPVMIPLRFHFPSLRFDASCDTPLPLLR